MSLPARRDDYEPAAYFEYPPSYRRGACLKTEGNEDDAWLYCTVSCPLGVWR